MPDPKETPRPPLVGPPERPIAEMTTEEIEKEIELLMKKNNVVGGIGR